MIFSVLPNGHIKSKSSDVKPLPTLWISSCSREARRNLQNILAMLLGRLLHCIATTPRRFSSNSPRRCDSTLISLGVLLISPDLYRGFLAHPLTGVCRKMNRRPSIMAINAANFRCILRNKLKFKVSIASLTLHYSIQEWKNAFASNYTYQKCMQQIMEGVSARSHLRYFMISSRDVICISIAFYFFLFKYWFWWNNILPIKCIEQSSS